MKKILLTLATLICFYANAQTNYAIDFDGTNDFIVIPDNNAIDLSANFTLEAWIFPTGIGSSGTEGGIVLNKEHSYEIARFPDGTIRFALSGNGLGNDWTWISTGSTAALNTWSHIALVKTGSTVTFYLNGVQTYSNGSQPATLTANGNALWFGGRSSAGSYFDGIVDNVRIWNTSRTAANIKYYMYDKDLSTTASGLVGYYKMNAGTGTSAVNYATNFSGLIGTLTNGPTWVSSPVDFSANALSFDGSNDHVVIPQSISSDFTIEYWVRTTSTGPGTTGTQWYGGNGIVDAEVGGGTTDFGTALTGSKWAFGIGNPDITIHSTTDINTGTWFHVAATWEQGTGDMNLYVNGNLEASTSGSTSLRSAPTRITLGMLQTNMQYFNGEIDELRIWNVVRSQAQIQANQSAEIDPATSGLVAYYTFNQGLAAGTNSGIANLIDITGNNNGTLNNFNLSGSSSNFVVQNSGFFLLPLDWVSFTANKEGESTRIHWTTSNELNTSHFNIEYSTDGRTWLNLTRVQAQGNRQGLSNYSYTHFTPVKGINYYRIRQVDIDGRSSYSETRSVKFTGKAGGFTVITNPVQGGQLQIQSENNITVSVYELSGKLILKQNILSGRSTVDLSGVKSGVYLVSDGIHTEKIIL